VTIIIYELWQYILMALVKNNVSIEEWREYHDAFQATIGEKTDPILNRLSEEFHLGKQNN